MAKNNDDLPNSDISQSNNKMTDSNVEDDTEDYIQPSQPLSFQSPGVESVSKRIQRHNDLGDMNISTIDETLPFPKLMVSTPFGEVSRDFIPESENPVKRKIEILDMEEGCKKRLNLDLSSLIKETPDMFSSQSQTNDTIDASHLKVSESPSNVELGNVSLVPESPPRINAIVESEHSYTMFSESGKRGVLEETAADDSCVVESADVLYVPDSSKNEISDIREEERMDRIDDNVGNEIITIDSSSKFIDDSRMTSLTSDNTPDVEGGKGNVGSPETKLDDTIDADDIKCFTPYSNERTDGEAVNGNAIPSTSEGFTTPIERASGSASTRVDTKPEISRPKSVLKNFSDEELARLQKHSTPENPLSKSPKINESASSIENGTPPVEDGLIKSSELNFTVYLQMDCQLVIDPRKGEPISKKIVNVKELVKRQPKQFILEPNSDSSYKTKRLSSSSSGSVYSDKTGLPYALPNRSLPISVNSSSSSVDLPKHIQIVGRQVWTNEYKIPLAMDEILPRYIEHHKLNLLKNDGKLSTKRKMSMKMRKKSHWSHPLDNVVESSMTEQSSGNNSDALLQRSDKAELPKQKSPKDLNGTPEPDRTKSEEKNEGKEVIVQEENIVQKGSALSPRENESTDCIMTEGLLVFARWTDKRYYPGVLQSKAKYDRWNVKFDDDTEKVIREDLILPLNWLTKGELVFALAADKYMSGKIADIIREEDIQFKIELDDTNEEVNVKKCDLCLNDVMAGIIREKFKPSNKAILPLKACDIDVDNVLTGKRVREQRTPVRGIASVLQSEGSTAKKRKGGLRLSESGADDKQTPVKKQTPLTILEAQSEKKTRSSRKKGGRKNLTSSVPPEVDVPSTVEKTPIQSEGRKKRARTLKYDTDKRECSTRKSEKLEALTNDKTQRPVIQKEPIGAIKTVNDQTESAMNVGANVENTGDTERGSVEEPGTWKKAGKSLKSKGDKGGGKLSARPVRSKSLQATQDVKKKKKNA